MHEVVGWQHQHNGHGLGQTLGDSEGQGSLACCNKWGRRVGHDLATEQQIVAYKVVLASIVQQSESAI